ncbi:MAG: type II secretion system GspH family protein [Deferribacteraceae bacterium]|jgi:prepilin-type N-terminal cleavage/methylation domain-containing protein|nr:type II secretion system GspH family protein [Deferribacteraceae bacterium]
MKKAFNLVELAVVLLIVGIVAGMVLKGKSLLHASYYKSEVHKVDKIRSAVFALMAKYNGSYRAITFKDNKTYDTLDNNTNTIFDYAQFFDNGLLDENSVKVQYTDNWSVALCATKTDELGYYITKKDSPNYICAYHPKLLYDIMCNLEVLMDDQSLTDKNGFGLVKEVPNAYKSNFDSDNKTFNCDDVNSTDGLGVFPAYGYLVFK